MLGGHPHLGRLFDNLLADGMYAGVKLRNRKRALAPRRHSCLKFGKKRVEGFHEIKVSVVR